MFIELVDALRCPVSHEESWLVASAVRTEARHIVIGTLGCPVCQAEYPIRDGVVDFRRDAIYVAPAVGQADPELAMRIAALLDLADSRGFAVLLGDWGRHAVALAGIVELPLLLVDPPEDVTGSPGISVIRTEGEAIPLAMGSARATAIDSGLEARIAAAVRMTKTGGRVIGPAGVSLPPGVRELARDESMWVAEREPDPSPLISLHVRRAQG
ncbi:MAG: hypothetical protein V4550_16680 [Gemmatimonadota bacterium]